MNGWPQTTYSVDEELKPFWIRKNELSTEQGIVLWGLRVIIPSVLQSRVLDELHTEHTGIVRMKSLAGSFVWWPTLDQDIEKIAKSCEDCQSTRNTPASAPLHDWPVPTKAWERVHIDFAEYQGQSFLVLIDAYSKWPEVHLMSSTTTTKTITVLRHIFATQGLPHELVSDNGPQFVSEEFTVFMTQNGIIHKRSPPYHPQTNGAAERFVQVLKNHLKRGKGTNTQKQLSQLLIKYRSTPHTITGRTPAEVLMSRQIRTRLSLVQADMRRDMVNKQLKQNSNGKTKKLRNFEPGDKVTVRRFLGPNKWIYGTVTERLGPVSYIVEAMGQFIHVHVHIDHLLEAKENRDGSPVYTERYVEVPVMQPSQPAAETTSSVHDDQLEPPTQRYSRRVRRPPQRLDL